MKDTGIGIPAEQQTAVFESFVQADGHDAQVRRHGPRADDLAPDRELMGGKIGVESAPGKGSEFWVELPLEKARGAPRGRTPRAYAARAR